MSLRQKVQLLPQCGFLLSSCCALTCWVFAEPHPLHLQRRSLGRLCSSPPDPPPHPALTQPFSCRCGQKHRCCRCVETWFPRRHCSAAACFFETLLLLHLPEGFVHFSFVAMVTTALDWWPFFAAETSGCWRGSWWHSCWKCREKFKSCLKTES